MATSLVDSRIYGGLWGAEGLREVFDERPRTRDWLEILAVLAETQAALDLIPGDDANAVAATCRSIEVDGPFLEAVRQGRERTGHSTLGLIQTVRARCPGTSGEWLYYGATVQDLTDTWMMRALDRTAAFFAANLETLGRKLRALMARHRDTVMLGRTHGQAGLPITFGFKVASWADEVARHRGRLGELSARLGVGQLCGGVGSLSSFGPRAFELQARFLDRLGLRAPRMSWTASRDVFSEWGHFLTLVVGTADRIGHEVYNLQRPEIGELSEGFAPGTVGSITMPHKRNPEISEHIGTLARVVRHRMACLDEGLVHDHERDGRSWKTEWATIPDASLAAGRAVELLVELVGGLNVHPDRMRANLDAAGDVIFSERVMLGLARHVGRQSAHRLVYRAAMNARASGRSLRASLLDLDALPEPAAGDLDRMFDEEAATGHCRGLVDRFLEGEP